MLTSTHSRQTRSGHVFSQYTPPPLVVHTDCDIDGLLTTACLNHHDEDPDHYPIAGPDEDQWEASPLSSAPPSPKSSVQDLPYQPPISSTRPVPLTRQERSRRAKKDRRRRKRQQQRDALEGPEYVHRPSQSKKYEKPAAIPTNFKVETLPAAGTGFVGVTQSVHKAEGSLQTLLSQGFCVKGWDGW